MRVYRQNNTLINLEQVTTVFEKLNRKNQTTAVCVLFVDGTRFELTSDDPKATIQKIYDTMTGQQDPKA